MGAWAHTMYKCKSYQRTECRPHRQWRVRSDGESWVVPHGICSTEPRSPCIRDLDRRPSCWWGLAVDQVLNPHSEVTALHADRV